MFFRVCGGLLCIDSAVQVSVVPFKAWMVTVWWFNVHLMMACVMVAEALWWSSMCQHLYLGSYVHVSEASVKVYGPPQTYLWSLVCARPFSWIEFLYEFKCAWFLSMMESKSDNSNTTTGSQIPTLASLNVKITPELFNGTDYKDWAYSATMAIGGTWRLGDIDETIKEPNKSDPKYSDWVSKNMCHEFDPKFHVRRNCKELQIFGHCKGTLGFNWECLC